MILKVGIIGAGHMGKVHAKILSRDKRVKIMGVSDVVKEKGEKLAKLVNACFFPDLASMLDYGIDVLYVTTPNKLHVKPTITALKENVHVFCEKPFATSLQEAQEILDIAKESRAIYQGGHNRRFAPVYSLLKERITQGFTPFLAHIKQNDGDLLDPPWLSDPKKTGGYLYETAIHLLDIALWLMGDVVEVKAIAKDNLYPDLVDWGILISFQKEKIGTLSSSGHASWYFPTERVEIVGDHATLITEELDVAIYSKGLKQPCAIMNFAQLPNDEKWGYTQENKDFIDAILGEKKSAFSLEDGFRIVQLIEACYESARTGKSVSLPE